jgi:hypothetical protein
VYDLINQQSVAIQGFFVRLKLNLETKDVPAGLKVVFVKIMVCVLKICGIATGYVKGNVFKRCKLPKCLQLIDSDGKPFQVTDA